MEMEMSFIVFCLDDIQSWMGVCDTGHVNLPLTSSFTVSSSLLPISSRTPLILMTAFSSGRVGNEPGFSNMTARRKLAASVA